MGFLVHGLACQVGRQNTWDFEYMRFFIYCFLLHGLPSAGHAHHVSKTLVYTQLPLKILMSPGFLFDGWMDRRLAGWLVVRLVGWLAGWLVGYWLLAGGLIDWLAR